MQLRSGLCSVFLLFVLLLVACEREAPESAVVTTVPTAPDAQTLRIYLDPLGKGGSLARLLIQEFSLTRGIPVQILTAPQNSTDMLASVTQILASRSTAVDVVMIDVVWPPILHPYLDDLSSEFAQDVPGFFPQLIRNNTVHGRLVGIPVFVDTGILYYRRDLLDKYGFDAPPETWEDLELMAAAIQQGERAAGHDQFWGLAVDMFPQESLTCIGLEWQSAEGGGNIVNDRGIVTLDNEATAAAFERAKGWLGTIARPDAVEMNLEDSRRQFQDGNAAFMRSWSYAAETLERPGSAVAGRVGLAAVPAGAAGRRAVLGGWQLAVSASCEKKAQAYELVRYLTSPGTQRRRAITAGFPPARPEIYEDAEVIARQPHLAMIKASLPDAVYRPSRGTGALYPEVSLLYYKGLSRMLRGEVEVKAGLTDMSEQIKKTLDQ